MIGGPLADRRVVVTRATEQSEALLHRLRELGAQPIALALIEIVDPSDGGLALRRALERLSTFDWLVVSSPNGARRVRDAVLKLATARPKIAAVGRATADEIGASVELIAQRQIAEGLLADFPSGVGTVILAQAEGARPELERGLGELGWHVEAVPAYRTISRPPTDAERAEVIDADAVLFASGSAVWAWVEAFGTTVSPPVITIGPATAEVAVRLGLKVDAIATDHSLNGLVQCLMAYFLEHG
jgi:uroporphyrinogen-III synthase